MFGRLSLSMTLKAHEITELNAANAGSLVADATGIPLSLLMLTIVSKIYGMQMTHHEQSLKAPTPEQ